jgi:hypothetical protein
MKIKSLIPIITSVILLIVLVVMACTPNAVPTPTATQTAPTPTQPAVSPSTPTPQTQIVYKDQTYNAVNPTGDFVPVQTKALAARLDTIDGKIIYVVQGEADPVIMPALIERLKKDYPKTTWNFYQPSSSFGLAAVDATMKAEAKGLIRGVGW